jgi:acetoin utilization deacetylase AcuC-like enzyme
MVEPESLLVVDDPSFDRHSAPDRHPECPERLVAARSGLAAALPPGARITLEATPASDADLLEVHTPQYLQAIDAVFRRAAQAGGFGAVDADTYVGPGTREAALRAAGGAAILGRALMRGRGRRGIALLRPPGHHAEPARAMGFCLFNNVAIAASAALQAGARRVAIVDWDVHHGNGTQKAFESDDRVLFVSLHQWPLYPGTGAPSEIGIGRGLGSTANLALPPGSGPEEYGEAFRRVVLPLVAAFAPDLILVSAGYDAHRNDPLAAMRLDAPSYQAMTSALVAVAEQLGHGRVGLVLEGGYHLAALEACVAATVRALRGERLALPDEKASPAATAAIDATVRALAPHRPELSVSR